MTAVAGLAGDQPEVIKRLAAAIELDVMANRVPSLHTVPAVLLRWDFTTGILRVAFAFNSELDVHLCYLRICDLQLTFGQFLEAAAKQTARDAKLNAIGEVMGGRKVASLVSFDG